MSASTAAAAEGGGSETVKFGSISLGGQSLELVGELRIGRSGLAWRSQGGKKEFAASEDLRQAQWIPIGRYFQLKLFLKGGSSIRFDGFRQQDWDGVARCFQDFFGIPLQTAETSITGWNWGDVLVDAKAISFDVEQKRLFEIPLSEVANCTMAKGIRAAAHAHTVDVELHQPSAAAEVDSLVELKLYVPSADDDASEVWKRDNAGPDGKVPAALANDAPPNKAARLCQQIVEHAELGVSGGAAQPICSLADIGVVTPRNKFELQFFASFFLMLSEARQFKVMYSQVVRLFNLPKPDGRTIVFVVSVDPPLRQGHNTYPHIVMHLNRDENINVPIELPDATLREKYGAQLGPALSTSLVKGLLLLFNVLVDKKPNVPGSFKSSQAGHVIEMQETDEEGNATVKRQEVHSSAVRCVHRANSGLLYPLERGFFFIYKPPMYVRFSELVSVEFSRVSAEQTHAAQQNFDFNLNLKAGSQLQFSNVHRSEFKPIFKFCTDKGLKIINVDGDVDKDRRTTAADLDLDDDDDAPNIGINSESEDEDFDFDNAKGDEDEISEELATPPESDDDASDSSDSGDGKAKQPKKKQKTEAEEGGMDEDED